jgi:drug/metabolite transporter (DMT)-like permease
MADKALFWIPTLIWATTWHALTHQTGVVPITQSIAYRFFLAGCLFFVYARIKGETVWVPLRLHGPLALVGVVQFGLNYWCTYAASQVITSGLLAVLFSWMVFSNAIAGHFLFHQPLSRRFVWACLLGVTGIALIFWPEIVHTQGGWPVWRGVALGLVAVVFATTGNVLTLQISPSKMPLVPVLAWAMVYGAVALFVAGQLAGQPLLLDTRPSYWISFAYLTVIGSFTAFLFYFKLAQRDGPGKAGMVGLVIPLVALAVSAAFEGWRPTWMSGAGLLCCLLGLWWANENAPKTS